MLSVKLLTFVLFAAFVVKCLLRFWLRLSRAVLFANFVVRASLSSAAQ